MLKQINGIFFAFWVIGGKVFRAEVTLKGRNVYKKLETTTEITNEDPKQYESQNHFFLNANPYH
jgi:hypothetical protein